MANPMLCLLEILSLYIIADTIVVKSKLPTLYTGNSITDGILPDKFKFKRFKAPTHTPKHIGTIMLFNDFLLCGLFASFFVSKAVSPVNKAEKNKEYAKNKGSSSA